GRVLEERLLLAVVDEGPLVPPAETDEHGGDDDTEVSPSRRLAKALSMSPRHFRSISLIVALSNPGSASEIALIFQGSARVTDRVGGFSAPVDVLLLFSWSPLVFFVSSSSLVLATGCLGRHG